MVRGGGAVARAGRYNPSPMDGRELAGRLSQGEGQNLEFKATTAESAEATRSLGAFRNTDGGAVVFGISPSGEKKGVSIGANTLERLATGIGDHTDPRVQPTIEVVVLDERKYVVVSVDAGPKGSVTYAHGDALVRVGPTNQRMSSEEQRRRHREGDHSIEHRPRFSVQRGACSRAASAFEPEFTVTQSHGDFVTNLKWRIRGPRFGGVATEWRGVRGESLARTKLLGEFDVSSARGTDLLVQPDELGVEIRFHWEGEWRHELHRFPMSSKNEGFRWDLADPEEPPQEWDSDIEPGRTPDL